MKRRITLEKTVVRVFSGFAILAAFLLAFLNPGVVSRASEEKSLTLLYTGDLKGQLTPQKG